MGTWRQYYAPEIAKIIADNKEKDQKELKRILQQANPGQYKHMKRIWANEYMRQLGLSKKKVKLTDKHIANPNQLELGI